MRRRWEAVSAAVGVLLALVVLAGAAFAVNQANGRSYKGGLLPATRGISVSFEVSGSGKQVSSLTISNIPLYCSGGGPAIPVHFKNASISSQGAFTSSAQNIIKIGPLEGQVGEKLKITGKFLRGRREQGTLTTVYPKAPACGGKSPYTTKA